MKFFKKSSIISGVALSVLLLTTTQAFASDLHPTIVQNETEQMEHIDNEARLTGSKTFSHTGSMGITNLAVGQSRDSNNIVFNLTGLPSDAQITSISIDTGASNVQNSQTGIIIGNSITVEEFGYLPFTTPWNGGNNSVIKNITYFNGNVPKSLNVRWNGTALAGSAGTVLNPTPGPAVGRYYNNVKLTVNYTY